MLADPAIVDNDFHRTHDIFNLFEGLEVQNMDKTTSPATASTNGHEASNGNQASNGLASTNGSINGGTKAIDNSEVKSTDAGAGAGAAAGTVPA